MNLTPSQLRAATTLDRPVVVTAGPGSGKTRVLVARYLEILESGSADIENIVAITFTNKAAAEMRDRVRGEMDKRAIRGGELASRTVWRQRRRKLDSAVITTFHGFCSRLLREHPIEAGIDPQFVTLDSYQVSVLTDSASHAAVTGAIDDGSTQVAELVASYSRAGLVRAIERVHRTIRSLGLSLDDIVRTTELQLGTVDDWTENVTRVRSELDEALATLEVLPEKPKSTRKAKFNAARQIEEFAVNWSALEQHVGQASPEVFDPEFFALLARLGASVPKGNITKRLRPFVKVIHDLVGKSGLDGTLGGAALDIVARGYLPVFADLVRTMDGLYAAEKRAVSALDFEDLQLEVRRLLDEHPDLVRRVRSRYRYFLVDEYQDTNGLQRDIVKAFVEGPGAANLFVVGDPKQSIYGFRGAEVSVFAETSRDIEARDGERMALATNFRSDGRIVTFVGQLFDRIMRPPASLESSELESLGFVNHEASEAEHVPDSPEPVVELILSTTWTSPEDSADESRVERSADEDDESEEGSREHEARLLAERLRELVESGEPIVRAGHDDDAEARRGCRYGDIALLLRTMSHVKDYERALRRARVPFYVIAGKGFYDRSETRDLLQVLSFLDNETDELALAAVLRSPLFGVSDETLLALRIDRLAVAQATGRRPRSGKDRPLWQAVVDHHASTYVSADQRRVLDRAVGVLRELRTLRNRIPISALLRRIIERTQIDAVVAASDDGAQRLSNMDKLVAVARQFERGSGRLLGDFTEYVREFHRLESDEAEANVRADADAVAVMTVHKSKGLEFPVVAIADLQSTFRANREDVLLDRECGLGFRVPDGTARHLPTRLHHRLAERLRIRERFEAMRTLYVAATRAEDRLLLSASTKEIRRTEDGVPVVADDRDALSDRCWLAWLLRAVAESGGRFDLETNEVQFGDSRIRLIRGTERDSGDPAQPSTHVSRDEDASEAPEVPAFDAGQVATRVESLMRPLGPSPVPAATRFGVTSLLGYETCPRRFLYGRLLRIPELSDVERIRDVSERPEPGLVLPASLRGIVAHRFCETLRPDESVDVRLARAVADVRRDRGDAYEDVLAMTDDARIVDDVKPLAESYAQSALRARVDSLTHIHSEMLSRAADDGDGQGYVVSEMGFSLRFSDGSVVGSVDKLLLEPDGVGGWRAEVVDFKTNRIARTEDRVAALAKLEIAYRLQMQAYSLAVRRLVPKVTSVSATLVALAAGPDVEVTVDPFSLSEDVAGAAIRVLLSRIRDAGTDPADFPARPGLQCSSCAHVTICPEGSAHVR